MVRDLDRPQKIVIALSPHSALLNYKNLPPSPLTKLREGQSVTFVERTTFPYQHGPFYQYGGPATFAPPSARGLIARRKTPAGKYSSLVACMPCTRAIHKTTADFWPVAVRQERKAFTLDVYERRLTLLSFDPQNVLGSTFQVVSHVWREGPPPSQDIRRQKQRTSYIEENKSHDQHSDNTDSLRSPCRVRFGVYVAPAAGLLPGGGLVHRREQTKLG
ncbi:hypothetical protein EDD16DRAFT_1900293 [Pisolithus croceorrhizus]|nr:hypothetical protein EDD16DRAFT_1900293 [Pisolithus croceorrhizus]